MVHSEIAVAHSETVEAARSGIAAEDHSESLGEVHSEIEAGSLDHQVAGIAAVGIPGCFEIGAAQVD